MNIRSLTRGDGVVIGAAVLLFIASFLDYYSVNGDCGPQCPSLTGWQPDFFPTLPSIFLAGVIAAGLIVAPRLLPENRKVAGLGLDQWGTALALFATWGAVWGLFGGGSTLQPGIGMILAVITLLVMTAAAVLTPRTPALKVALLPAPRPAQPQPYPGAQPYGAQPGTGYGYPGSQPQQPYGAQPHEQMTPPPQPTAPQAAASTQEFAPPQEFAPFWFAVPVTRPLYPENGSPSPVAELTPGTWYLAVDQRGTALVAQTQDGRRGVLQDTTGIQRG
ncbi:MAG: hypothetical protein JO362_03885 [Streptomycetaceae bacterium]|nr:hypothetical protein [Streptomycetaceae bacterium]